MADGLLRHYHRLPPSLRSAVATARGAYLRAWRYGPGSERLVEEALDRDGWSEARWRAWQEERVARVLHRAATRVPYYRDQWAARRRRGDRASVELLANWPVLEKETLRAAPRAFVADDCAPARMFHDHTSGTSGKPVHLWLTRATVRAWYALYEARCRRWYGVSRHDAWAIFGGQLVAPAAQAEPPFWVWNAALHQLYLSSYHLAPLHAAAYAAALRAHGVVFALAYPSALAALAREILAQGIDAPRLRVAVMNAEPVYAHQREDIERAFGCPVRETYGMAEIAAAATECEHGALHLWPEAGHVEVLDGDAEVPPGGTGDLVCTGLLNADMPLVRYRVGDRGALRVADAPCACGRSLPRLAGVEGRLDDVLFTADGRAVGRLDPVFKADLPIREAQIVQEALDRVRLRYVPTAGFDAAHGATLRDRVRDRMGPVNVVLEPVERIERTSNGKFRAVLCRLPADELARLRRGETSAAAPTPAR